jgi:hypothetical protein
MEDDRAMTRKPSVDRLSTLILAGSLGLALVAAPTVLATTTPKAAAAKDHVHDHDHDHDHGDDSLEKGKHVHGEVTFNLALDGDALTVELDAPAINVVGFEKAPRTDAERKAVASVDAWLSGGREIAAVPVNAGCRLQRVDYTPPKLGSGHADYRAQYTFRCSNPNALAWVELWALRKLNGVERAEANVITATVQRQQDLSGGMLRFSLK